MNTEIKDGFTKIENEEQLDALGLKVEEGE